MNINLLNDNVDNFILLASIAIDKLSKEKDNEPIVSEDIARLFNCSSSFAIKIFDEVIALEDLRYEKQGRNIK